MNYHYVHRFLYSIHSAQWAAFEIIYIITSIIQYTIQLLQVTLCNIMQYINRLPKFCDTVPRHIYVNAGHIWWYINTIGHTITALHVTR